MPAIHLPCTGCGACLKAPAGKNKVRCPRCGTVLQIPQTTEEPAGERRARPSRASGGEALEEEQLDQLEEVDDAPAPVQRRHIEEDWPIRQRQRTRKSAGDGPWSIAVGAAVACFFVGFAVTLVAFGFKGLPENQEEGGVLVKIGALAFGVFVALVLAFMGVIGVKNRALYDRWGNVTTGPVAVVLAMIVTILGGSLGGFVVYALLMALIQGR